MPGLKVAVEPRGFAVLEHRIKTAKKNLAEQTKVTMQRATLLAETELKKVEFTGSKGFDAFWGVIGAGDNKLGARSGHARRSITSRVFARANEVIGVVGSRLKYVGIHETGGTIFGKPWLVIRTAVAQRAGSGTAKPIPRANTAIIRSRAGNLWIAEVGTPRAKLAQEINGVPLLLAMLVRRVRVRARGMFRRTLKRLMPQFRKMFRDAVGRSVSGKAR